MKKAKIAISLDESLLELVDSKVDGHILRSRSQAIEFYLQKGLDKDLSLSALIMIKGEHQKYSLRKLDGKPLLLRQIEFLIRHGITKIFILTQKSEVSQEFEHMVPPQVKVLERDAKGTAEAVLLAKPYMDPTFLVMSGDIFNDFDLRRMISKHMELGKIATIGLISVQNTEKKGTCVLDGDFVVDFEENPKKPKSNNVNAGIYLFNKGIFDYLKNARSLEKEVLPRLSVQKEMVGFFTHGKFIHMEEL